jgi:hypothetical protein
MQKTFDVIDVSVYVLLTLPEKRPFLGSKLHGFVNFYHTRSRNTTMNYRIVCTDQEPAYLPPSHAHIVAVGIGPNAGRAENRMTLTEVLTALDQGHVFYTYGEQSGRTALVRKAACPHCGRDIIKSAPDAVHDNNLDSLRYCAWQAAA